MNFLISSSEGTMARRAQCLSYLPESSRVHHKNIKMLSTLVVFCNPHLYGTRNTYQPRRWCGLCSSCFVKLSVPNYCLIM